MFVCTDGEVRPCSVISFSKDCDMADVSRPGDGFIQGCVDPCHAESRDGTRGEFGAFVPAWRLNWFSEGWMRETISIVVTWAGGSFPVMPSSMAPWVVEGSVAEGVRWSNNCFGRPERMPHFMQVPFALHIADGKTRDSRAPTPKTSLFQIYRK